MGKLALAVSFAAFLVGGAARADGCYLCEGGGAVKFAGQDNWALRHKAEACGCKIVGTASACPNGRRVLCAVARGDSVKAPATAQAPLQR